MTSGAPAYPLQLVVDPGVYVSAAITGREPATAIIDAAVAGRCVLFVSPLLIAELRGVLAREKFRRYLSISDAVAFSDALVLLARSVDDPPQSEWHRACRDPNDDYLIALAESVEAHFLVSGDRDVLAVERPTLAICTPRQALDALRHEHPWGEGLIPADPEQIKRTIEAEGHGRVTSAAASFIAALAEPNAAELLEFIVTPESLPLWQEKLAEAQGIVHNRGMAGRPEYPAPDIAYVKLPPDPGENIRATGNMTLPVDTAILTLQRRPELPEIVDLGYWRVHAVGGQGVLPEEMPDRD